MNNETKLPILLNCKELLKPVIDTRNRIDEISDEIDKTDKTDIINDGLFVLSVASIETMILDVSRYYLKCFPYKLRKKSFEVTKIDLIHHPRKLINLEIDKELLNVSYSGMEQIIEYFCDLISIPNSNFSNVILEQFKEIKARRNLLLHNNLIVNKIYLETAGLISKEISVGSKLIIDSNYLKEALQLFENICSIMLKAIDHKYSVFTHVAAIKSLWKFIFKSPVLVFEEYWNIDYKNDNIPSFNESVVGKWNLSSSEEMFLGVWRSYFHGDSNFMKVYSMKKLDRSSQERMLYFLSILDEFSLE